jgi:hypothetical protein
LIVLIAKRNSTKPITYVYAKQTNIGMALTAAPAMQVNILLQIILIASAKTVSFQIKTTPVYLAA